MTDAAPEDGGRNAGRRWPWWVKVLIGLGVVAWPLVLLAVIERFAVESATRIVWHAGLGTPVEQQRFTVLAFADRADPACAGALAPVQRAILMTLSELESPEVEVFVGGAPVRVPRGCVTLLPPAGDWEAMIAGLNAEIRAWGPKETELLSVKASTQVVASGATEVTFVRRSDDYIDTFVYQTDGLKITPIRIVTLSGKGAGITGAGLILAALALHFVLVLALLVVWGIRRWIRGRKATGVGG